MTHSLEPMPGFDWTKVTWTGTVSQSGGRWTGSGNWTSQLSDRTCSGRWSAS